MIEVKRSGGKFTIWANGATVATFASEATAKKIADRARAYQRRRTREQKRVEKAKAKDKRP